MRKLVKRLVLIGEVGTVRALIGPPIGTGRPRKVPENKREADMSSALKSLKSTEWRPASVEYDVSGRMSLASRAESTDKLSELRHSHASTVGIMTTSAEPPKDNGKQLMISFCLMIIVGLGNKIFQKLQTGPMVNYPNFLNLMTTFCYIPLSFAYIIPMQWYGKLSEEELAVPKKTFIVIGILDGVAGIMQVFSATYLPGSLLILLQQAAIPISMVISKLLLRVNYNYEQYLGAAVVAAGIATVLVPKLGDGGDDESNTPMWAMLLMASCIPMCLSSVYKEIALGDTEMDAVYMNGWIAVFQFLISLPLAVPGALAGDPKVEPADLPENIWDGARCFGGYNSITNQTNPDAKYFDDCYPMAAVYVSVYLLFNVGYNILILIIIKFGSSNILWLAMTVMVPLGNMAFTLDFIPNHQSMKATDVVGLVIIMMGLIGYRYWAELEVLIMGHVREGALDDEERAKLERNREQEEEEAGTLNAPLLGLILKEEERYNEPQHSSLYE